VNEIKIPNFNHIMDLIVIICLSLVLLNEILILVVSIIKGIKGFYLNCKKQKVNKVSAEEVKDLTKKIGFVRSSRQKRTHSIIERGQDFFKQKFRRNRAMRLNKIWNEEYPVQAPFRRGNKLNTEQIPETPCRPGD